MLIANKAIKKEFFLQPVRLSVSFLLSENRDNARPSWKLRLDSGNPKAQEMPQILMEMAASNINNAKLSEITGCDLVFSPSQKYRKACSKVRQPKIAGIMKMKENKYHQ